MSGISIAGDRSVPTDENILTFTMPFSGCTRTKLSTQNGQEMWSTMTAGLSGRHPIGDLKIGPARQSIASEAAE